MAPFYYLTNTVICMATWVYKDGEGVLISPHDIDNHLKAGYTLDKDTKPKKQEAKKGAKKNEDTPD